MARYSSDALAVRLAQALVAAGTSRASAPCPRRRRRTGSSAPGSRARSRPRGRASPPRTRRRSRACPGTPRGRRRCTGAGARARGTRASRSKVGPRLAAVAEHHVVADLDAVLLGELGRLDDLVDGDLLVDRVEDLRRARLDARGSAARSRRGASRGAARRRARRRACRSSRRTGGSRSRMPRHSSSTRFRLVVKVSSLIWIIFTGSARDGALERVEHVAAPSARGSRGPRWSRRRRRCTPRGSRARSSRCACRSSRAARRARRGPRSAARSGPSTTRPPARYAVPASPCVGCPAARRSTQLEEGGLALADARRCRCPGGGRASRAASGVACGPPTTTCAAGVSCLAQRGRRAPRRGGSPSSRTCRRGRRRARASDLLDALSTRSAERLMTLTWCPARSACAPRAKRPYGVWKKSASRSPSRVLGGRPVAAHVGRLPRAGIFQGGG